MTAIEWFLFFAIANCALQPILAVATVTWIDPL